MPPLHVALARLVGAASLLLLAAACSSTAPGRTLSPGDLAGLWQVESIVSASGEPIPLPMMCEAYAQFETTAGTNGGAVSGKAGVNRFNTTWALEGAMLVFQPAATTRMAGPPESMKFEQLLLQLLAEPLHPRLQGEKLILRGTEGALQLHR